MERVTPTHANTQRGEGGEKVCEYNPSTLGESQKFKVVLSYRLQNRSKAILVYTRLCRQ